MTVETTSTAQSANRDPGENPGMSAGSHPLIFFDGVCGLCSHWVDFVMARDRRQVFRFAPLQGPTATERLHIAPDQPFNSVVLVDEAGEHRKSDAIWRMLIRLGGVWSVAGTVLRLTPRPIRNWGYDFVAAHRYQWFGKKETCRLPTPEERTRFLP